MRLLLDIDVLLDVVLGREPWSESAAGLLAAVDSGRSRGFVAPHSLPTIYWVVAKARDRGVATQAVQQLLHLVDVVPLGNAELLQALTLSADDFEDGMQAAAALRIDADYLVTRNERDFRSVPVRTADPSTILALLMAEDGS